MNEFRNEDAIAAPIDGAVDGSGAVIAAAETEERVITLKEGEEAFIQIDEEAEIVD